MHQTLQHNVLHFTNLSSNSFQQILFSSLRLLPLIMMRKCTPYCERVFNSFDEDRDGKITLSQLQDCIEMIGGGLSAEEAEMVAQPLISDGAMGLDEFARLVESESEEEKMEDQRKAFGMYKMEGEACITPRSLKRMLCRLGEWTLDECEVMISQFDINGDGVLNFHEFQLMMLN